MDGVVMIVLAVLITLKAVAFVLMKTDIDLRALRWSGLASWRARTEPDY